MKFRMLFPVAFLLMVFTVTQGMAAETAVTPATDRERALEEQVQQLDGDLAIASAQVDSFVLESTIQWDHFSSEWEADYLGFNKWTFSSPKSADVYCLPQFPEWFAEHKPELSRENFELQSVTISQGNEGDVILSTKVYQE